ncbi:MAG: BREX protein BrxB domain-containing protein, partial [Bacteroidota bacterium]
LFQDLGTNIKNNQVIESAILKKQTILAKIPKSILIVTDLEMLHPFSRFGPIEQSIYNQIEIPIIILYPGKKTGSALKFLGFYPEDGNYRSKHI